MPNKENIIGKGNRFSSTNQPKRNGRRRRLETILRDDYKLSIDDIRAMMSKGLLSTRSGVEDVGRRPCYAGLYACRCERYQSVNPQGRCKGCCLPRSSSARMTRRRSLQNTI